MDMKVVRATSPPQGTRHVAGGGTASGAAGPPAVVCFWRAAPSFLLGPAPLVAVEEKRGEASEHTLLLGAGYVWFGESKQGGKAREKMVVDRVAFGARGGAVASAERTCVRAPPPASQPCPDLLLCRGG